MFGFRKKKTKSISPTSTSVTQPKHTSYVETYRVAGVRYRLENLLYLKEENDDYSMTMREILDMGMEEEKIYQYSFPDRPIELVKEPDNLEDKNAIKVILDGMHIGYIPKRNNKHVAELMDSGRIGEMYTETTGGKYKIVFSDEDDNGKDIYTMDQDESTFKVVLNMSVRIAMEKE